MKRVMLTNDAGQCVGPVAIPETPSAVVRYRGRYYARNTQYGLIFRGTIMEDFRETPVFEVERVEESLVGDRAEGEGDA